mgnify:CR=1 FL=1
MESSIIAVQKDKLVVYHRDERILRELKEILEKRYGIELEPVFSSLCG